MHATSRAGSRAWSSSGGSETDGSATGERTRASGHPSPPPRPRARERAKWAHTSKRVRTVFAPSPNPQCSRAMPAGCRLPKPTVGVPTAEHRTPRPCGGGSSVCPPHPLGNGSGHRVFGHARFGPFRRVSGRGAAFLDHVAELDPSPAASFATRPSSWHRWQTWRWRWTTWSVARGATARGAVRRWAMATAQAKRRPGRGPGPPLTSRQLAWLRHRDRVERAIDSYLATDPPRAMREVIRALEQAMAAGDRASELLPAPGDGAGHLARRERRARGFSPRRWRSSRTRTSRPGPAGSHAGPSRGDRPRLGHARV